jgi:hypothetical protein
MQYNCDRKNNQPYSSLNSKTIKPHILLYFFTSYQTASFEKALSLPKKTPCYIYTAQPLTLKLR